MQTSAVSSEGYLPFKGHRVWYRIAGERELPGRLPLLVLHGGPGATHQYLESLSALAETGRRVIFYDQIGCGNSDHPTDPDFYSAELFVDELAAVRPIQRTWRLWTYSIAGTYAVWKRGRAKCNGRFTHSKPTVSSIT